MESVVVYVNKVLLTAKNGYTVFRAVRASHASIKIFLDDLDTILSAIAANQNAMDGPPRKPGLSGL